MPGSSLLLSRVLRRLQACGLLLPLGFPADAGPSPWWPVFRASCPWPLDDGAPFSDLACECHPASHFPPQAVTPSRARLKHHRNASGVWSDAPLAQRCCGPEATSADSSECGPGWSS